MTLIRMLKKMFSIISIKHFALMLINQPFSWPNQKMKNIDSYTHVRGESVYLDDIPVVNGTLYAAVFDSLLHMEK